MILTKKMIRSQCTLGKFYSDVYTDVAFFPQDFRDLLELIKYWSSHDEDDKDFPKGNWWREVNKSVLRTVMR